MLKLFKTKIPSKIYFPYAQTSSDWFENSFIVQWYTSLWGSSHWLAKAAQFFLSAATLHFSSLSGQSSTTSTVDGDTGQAVCWRKTIVHHHLKYFYKLICFFSPLSNVEESHYFKYVKNCICFFSPLSYDFNGT